MYASCCAVDIGRKKTNVVCDPTIMCFSARVVLVVGRGGDGDGGVCLLFHVPLLQSTKSHPLLPFAPPPSTVSSATSSSLASTGSSSSGGRPVSCQLCAVGHEAQYLCTVCNLYLCDMREESHRNNAVTRSHTLIKLGATAAPKVAAAAPV